MRINKTIYTYHSKFKLVLKLVILLLVIGSGRSVAQEPTKIMGTIVDAKSKAPLPFVSVYFKGTTIGTTTDFDGKYSIETRSAKDTLKASYVGYKTVVLPVVKYSFQVIDIALEPESFELGEVIITPGENPALALFRKVIENKPRNNPDKVEEYQCEAYTKTEFDLNNITDKFKNWKVLKPFQFLFKNVDTSTVNGKTYLPVLLSESFSDVYFRKNPRERKEIIKASKISGIENQSLSQFIGTFSQDIKLYDNFVTLFQKNFPSPISSLGLLYYKYYLVDSANIDGKWCYNLVFKPKRKQEFAFTGNVWITDTTFAVRKAEMKMVADANVNFIKDMVIQQDFDLIDGKQWMVTREKIISDFNILEQSKSTVGFYGTRTVLFSKYHLGETENTKVYTMPNNIEVLNDAGKHDADFWSKARPEQLSRREESVYHNADTLQQIPLFKTTRTIVEMLSTGYYVRGIWEWGPYASVYSVNALEGNRFRIGGRTSNNFSTRLMLESYLAYGTTDHTLKYREGFKYMFHKRPDRMLSASYKYDMEQLGIGTNAMREDFFLNSFFRRNPEDKLSLVKEATITYKHEWIPGFSNSVSLTHRDIYNLGTAKIQLYDPNLATYVTHNNIATSEVALDLHYGYREKVLAGEFERIVLSSQYPVVDAQFAVGIPNVMGSGFQYQRARVQVQQWFNWLSAGWSKYYVEAGKVWGKVPFPLLKIYSGNETFWYDEYAFNLMNYYEFVNDSYFNFLLTHHFEGFFLNHIPLMHKLKWREVIQLRGAAGNTTSQNLNYNKFPAGTYTLTKPYLEAGVGIENMFKVLRIDAMWRMLYNDHVHTSRFGVLISLNVDF